MRNDWCYPMLVSTACVGLATIPVCGQDDYITGTQANALGAGHGLVYWKADCSDPLFSTDRIEHVPPTGGISSRPYYRTTCTLPNRVLSKVSRDADGNYYFLDGNGAVRQFNANSSVTTTLGSADTPSNVAHNSPTAVSASRLFFTEVVPDEFGGFSKLFQVAHSPALIAPKLVVDFLLATEVDRVIRQIIAHSSDRVTYQSGFIFSGRLGQAVRSMRFEGGNLVSYWAQTTISSDCTAVAEHAGYLYWVDQSTDRLTARFRRASITDPTASTLLHTRTLTVPHSVLWLVTDGDFLYYFDWVPSGGSSGSGNLMRKEIGVGSAVTIAGPFNNLYTRDLCIEGDYLFWIETGLGSSSATKIRRLAVNTAAIVRDLRVTDLEVIQIVQDSTNGVPLIAQKPTVARAFARLAYSSIGETQITSPALNVILEGARGGTLLPGSPLTAYGTGPILSNPTDRLDPNNRQFLFYLPPEWTEPGTITLWARINPGRTVEETSYGNNSVSHTATFQERSCVGVSLYPLRHTLGTLGSSYSATYQSTFDRAEALLPTREMIVIFEGGDPLEEYEWDQANYGPYELSDADDDSWKVLWKLNNRYAWHHLSPPYCTSGPNFCGALFNTFAERAFNGISSWGAFICFLDTRYAGINNPQSGITWAHELGHNYGRDHVDCPAGGPLPPLDSGFPYPACQFGFANHHMGYDPLTRTFFRWDAAADLMSYGRPRWPSEHTWNAIRTEIAAPSPKEAEAGPQDQGPSQWFTSGVIHSDGTAEFEQTHEVEGAAVTMLQAKLAGSESKNYQVRGYDGDNKLLFGAPAGVWLLHDANKPYRVFAALTPTAPTARKLELAQIDPSAVLGSRKAGSGAPTVKILLPSGGSVGTNDPLVIEWTASDPDKDPLTYQVRFSSDDGSEWKVIGDGLRLTSLSVDHGPLAGGAKCRVEVRASDGIHSGVAVSEQFTLPESDPQAWIFFDTGAGRRSEWLETVYSPVGREVTARAKGYDSEDGSLPPGAFSWAVAGPDHYVGTGKELRLHNLAPGTYTVGLTARDSRGASAMTTAQLIVDPKYIPQTAAPITLDGRCLDPAYALDAYPASLRYTDARVAQLHGVYAGGTLCFCVANLPNGSNSLERLVIYFDRSRSSIGGQPGGPQSNQYRLRVTPSGDLTLAQGNGTGYTTLEGYEGIEARVWRGTETWSVEVSLPDSLTGGYAGQMIGLAFGHENRNSSLDDTYWPLSTTGSTPSIWSPCVLGDYADDPADADGDRLPDGWERQHLKGLSFGWESDPDKDGMNNGEEWTAGTDPLDADSRFVIVYAEHVANGVRVVWPSQTGRTYTLLRSNDLRAFEPVAERIGATPPFNSHVDTPSPTKSACYRVAVSHGR